MRRMHKKGALELSINAIVIVILAMTLLGLGLGFVRNMFKDIGSTTGQVQEQMREQITEQLRTGDKPLAFPTSEITISKKESRNLAIGVRNTEQGKKPFKVKIYLVNETDGVRKTSGTDADGISNPDTIVGNFVYNKGTFTLGVNQDQIMPIKYTAATTTGTNVYEIVVYINETDGWDEYATKSFFITIV